MTEKLIEVKDLEISSSIKGKHFPSLVSQVVGRQQLVEQSLV